MGYQMVNGQKVVKVFCHEEAAKEQLARRNRAWQEASSEANGSANAIMPMLDYLLYVLIAVLGAWMAISEMTNFGLTGTNVLTLGAIASFLTLVRSFSNPISQMSNQLNSIVTALAGASRIFAFLDETLVQDGMDKLMEGRTVFVIAHRLSTVRNADGIMVLPSGRIIERGTHDSLIAERDTYYQLYTGAFELE